MKPDFILFSDASAIPKNDTHSYKYRGGYACVILDTKSGKFVIEHKSSQSNNSYRLEILAVYLGIKGVISKVNHKIHNILIVSDCLSVVDTLNRVLSFSGKDQQRWLTKRGTYIRFASEYKKIYKLIKKYNLKIRIIHIKSHAYKSSKIDLQMKRKIEKSLKKNKILSDLDLSELFIQFNRLADLYAKSGLSKFREKYEKSPLWLR